MNWDWSSPNGAGVIPYRALPIDLTSHAHPWPVPLCPSLLRPGWGCTRRRGHTGRHACGDGARVVAVWS